MNMQTQPQKIVVECHPDGRSNLEALNFKGNACAIATREIELALAGGGSQNIDSKPKPEFYATNPTANTQRR